MNNEEVPLERTYRELVAAARGGKTLTTEEWYEIGSACMQDMYIGLDDGPIDEDKFRDALSEIEMCNMAIDARGLGTYMGWGVGLGNRTYKKRGPHHDRFTNPENREQFFVGFTEGVQAGAAEAYKRYQGSMEEQKGIAARHQGEARKYERNILLLMGVAAVFFAGWALGWWG